MITILILLFLLIHIIKLNTLMEWVRDLLNFIIHKNVVKTRIAILVCMLVITLFNHKL